MICSKDPGYLTHMRGQPRDKNHEVSGDHEIKCEVKRIPLKYFLTFI